MKRTIWIYGLILLVVFLVGLVFYNKLMYDHKSALVYARDNNINWSRGVFANPFVGQSHTLGILITEAGSLEIRFWKSPLPNNTTLTIRQNGKKEILRIAEKGYHNETIPVEPGEYVLEVKTGPGLFSCYTLGIKGSGNVELYPTLDEQDDQLIEANQEKGFHWQYLLYTPEKIRAGRVPILVNPNNTGRPSEDMKVHLVKAQAAMAEKKIIADQLGIPLLVPVFPRKETSTMEYSHSFDRKTLLTEIEEIRRLDLQLIAMIEDAREHLTGKGIQTIEKVVMGGFSSEGMFTNRFTMLHPERVLMAIVGAPGGWPMLPVGEYQGEWLRYPIGVADLEEITGEPLQVAEYAKIPHFFFMGTEDTNDSVIYRDTYDQEDEEQIFRLFGKTPLERWPLADAVYREVGCQAVFKTYAGVGHWVSDEMQQDIMEFIENNLKSM